MAKKQLNIDINVNAKNGEKTVGELNGEIEKTTKTVEQLNKEADEIKKWMQDVSKTSQAYKTLEKELEEVNRQLEEQKKALESIDYNSQTNNIKESVGAFVEMSTVAFSLSNAVGILNTDFEKYSKIMLTSFSIMQSSRMLMVRLQQVQNTLRKSVIGQNAAEAVSNQIKVANATATTAQTTATTAQTVATNKATIAQRLLNVVMTANPVWMLVGGITALVGVFALLGNATKKAKEEQDALNASMDRMNKELESNKEHIKFELELLRAKGATIEELEEKELELAQTEIDNSAQRQKALTDEYKKLEELIRGKKKLNAVQKERYKELTPLLSDEAKKYENLVNQIIILEEKIKTRKRTDEEKENKKEEKTLTVREEIVKTYDDEIKSIKDKIALLQTTDEWDKKLLNNEQQRLLALEKIDKTIRGWEELEDVINKSFNLKENNIYEEYANQLSNIEKETIEKLKELSNLTNKVAKDRANGELSALSQVKQNNNSYFDDLINSYKHLLDEKKITEEDFNKFKKEIDTQRTIEEQRLENENQKELLKIRQEYLDTYTSLFNDSIDDLSNSLISAFNGDFDVTLFKSLIDDVNELKNGFNEFVEHIQSGEFKEGITGAMEAIGAVAGAISNSVNGFIQSQTSNALQDIDNQYRAESENLNRLLQDRIISQENFNTKMRALEDNKRMREIQANRQAFNSKKANDMTQAGINTAVAITKAFADNGPIVGAVLAGVVGAMGGVQMALIGSKRFKAFRGGLVPGLSKDYDMVPSLLSPGEAVINRQSTEMFLPQLSAINKLGGGDSLAPFAEEIITNDMVFQNTQNNRVYVSETDIREVMERVQTIESNATFG